MEYKLIPLSSGKFAIVDADWYEMLSIIKWGWGTDGYAKKVFRQGRHPDGKRKKVEESMHRLIADPPPGFSVDHINMNRLDNRRSNLRVCTRTQNAMNTPKKKGTFSSSYKGVYWHKITKKWRAVITVNKKKVSLGLFENEIEAAQAYNKAASMVYGDFAQLNSTIYPPYQST